MSVIKTLLAESASMQVERIHSTQVVGVGKRGSFEMPYHQLVQRLGQPELHPQGSDVRVEWCFRATVDEEQFVFSVYNSPRYYDHVQPEEMSVWDINCKTPYQATLIEMFIKQR